MGNLAPADARPGCQSSSILANINLTSADAPLPLHPGSHGTPGTSCTHAAGHTGQPLRHIPFPPGLCCQHPPTLPPHPQALAVARLEAELRRRHAAASLPRPGSPPRYSVGGGGGVGVGGRREPGASCTAGGAASYSRVMQEAAAAHQEEHQQRLLGGALTPPPSSGAEGRPAAGAGAAAQGGRPGAAGAAGAAAKRGVPGAAPGVGPGVAAEEL